MGVILAILGTIVLGLIARWLIVEMGVWHQPLCCWLVKTATRQLPESERAAVLSEWLAIIEDLRSPTAQLLNSLSFLFSAFRIRQALDPEDARATAYAIRVMFLSFVISMPAGLLASLFLRDGSLDDVLAAMRSPTKLAAIVVLSLAVEYFNFRVMKWSYKRRRKLKAKFNSRN